MQYEINENHGLYIGVLEVGEVQINGNSLSEFEAAKVLDKMEVKLTIHADLELLLIDVSLNEDYAGKY